MLDDPPFRSSQALPKAIKAVEITTVNLEFGMSIRNIVLSMRCDHFDS